MKLRTCFESNEEAYSEGFFNLYDPGAGMYNYNFGYTHSEEKTIIETIQQLSQINLVKVETYALARLEEQNSQKQDKS